MSLLHHLVVVTGYDSGNLYMNDPLAVKVEGGTTIPDPEVGTEYRR